MAASPATIPATMNEIMTAGPAYRAAACPLKTNMPVPMKMIKTSTISSIDQLRNYIPMTQPMLIASNSYDLNVRFNLFCVSNSACNVDIGLRAISRPMNVLKQSSKLLSRLPRTIMVIRR